MARRPSTQDRRARAGTASRPTRTVDLPGGAAPAGPRFLLSARVSSDRPDAIRPVLEEAVGAGSIGRAGDEFVVETNLAGGDVKELNRTLLSQLRRVEKRTRLRARWTAADGTEYRFFDYVLKKTMRRGKTEPPSGPTSGDRD